MNLMNEAPGNITAELIESHDGRPVAYVDATAVAVFTHQEPDGSYLIDIHIRDDTVHGQLRIHLDGEPLPTDGPDRPNSVGNASITRHRRTSNH